MGSFPTEVQNKEEMWKRLLLGQFGNRFCTWENERDFLKAVANGFSGVVGVRCVGRPGVEYRVPGFDHHTQLSPSDALALGRILGSKYHCPVRYYESSPDHLLTIQGELSEVYYGYALEYTRVKTYLRAAFAVERLHDFHWTEPALIRKHFNDASLDDLKALFQMFPRSTIEFSCYSQNVGMIPGRNTILWECRNY